MTLISSFKLHMYAVCAIQELESGAIISISLDKMIIWNGDGTVLHDFTGRTYNLLQVIELKNDVIVSSKAIGSFELWELPSGESPFTPALLVLSNCQIASLRPRQETKR